MLDYWLMILPGMYIYTVSSKNRNEFGKFDAQLIK